MPENKPKSQFIQMEEDVLSFWQKGKIFEKSVARKVPKGDYVFYDGPPFITGLPHYATLLPSIAKDVVPRYWTMKGYRVERVWGWDCHGLPAENKVEEQLGLKNKKDIEALGVDKFVEACRNYVKEGSEQWRWYIDRIGRWVDMDNAYKTMDLNFMESVIWAFKELYDKGFIYEGYRSSLHCPRCATPLSKFEITMDVGSYKEITEESIIIKFKLVEKKDTYILVWTTTSWTLPGNLALAVGRNLDYLEIKISQDPNIYILAKERASEILAEKDYKIIREFKGKELIGLAYEPLFELDSKEIKDNRNKHKIYHGDFVSIEEGTGVVHIAPNFGEDDFEFGKKNNLPIVDIMDENGIYAKESGEWGGLFFKKAGKKALEKLGDRLFASFPIIHSYPFCYRCKHALIYKTQKAWYLDIDKIRKKLLSSNKDINWVPEFFKKGRFQYNLESAPHWCLSRSRYWGSPVPVWRCEKCSKIKVIGSIRELEELSGQKINDLHRPAIDNINFKCKCGGTMKRVLEVLDCWFESASMPYAQFHYPFERKDNWKNIFPADFIIEYTGQLRGWFYYLHVLANCLFNSITYKNVIVTGVLFGTDGRKMSKSYGNYPDPRNTIEKYGADALRMYLMGSSIMLADDINLSEKEIEDSLRKNIILLWNVYKFYGLFADQKTNIKKEPKSKNVLDKWILSRLNQLIKEVTENMEKYNIPNAVRPITIFINDLSTWYLRRSRDRFKKEDEKDKKLALEITGYVLLKLSEVIAPFTPFIAETLWQKLTGNDFSRENKSVHLEAWPEAEKIDEKIITEMETTRKVVELGLAKRDEAGIRVRQPLGELRVENVELKDEYIELIKDELNVKVVTCEEGKGELNTLLNTELTPKLIAEGVKREVVRFVNAMRKDNDLTIKDRISIYYKTKSTDLKKAIEEYNEDIKKDTLADSLEEGQSEINKEVKINDNNITLSIKKN